MVALPRKNGSAPAKKWKRFREARCAPWKIRLKTAGKVRDNRLITSLAEPPETLWKISTASRGFSPIFPIGFDRKACQNFKKLLHRPIFPPYVQKTAVQSHFGVQNQPLTAPPLSVEKAYINHPRTVDNGMDKFQADFLSTVSTDNINHHGIFFFKIYKKEKNYDDKRKQPPPNLPPPCGGGFRSGSRDAIPSSPFPPIFPLLIIACAKFPLSLLRKTIRQPPNITPKQ